MKTNVFTKLAAVVAIATTAWAYAPMTNAQITYDQEGINIRNAPKKGSLDLSVKMNGMYWTVDSSRFFLLDVTPSCPRLAGANDRIAFYNTLTRTFNNIEVANVFNKSDARAKTNIQTLSNGLETVLNLRPVSYYWKNTNSETDNQPMMLAMEYGDLTTISNPGDSIYTAIGGPSGERNAQYGFLAQEVEDVIPDIVQTGEDGVKMMNYIALIPMLVQSIQELHAVVEQQNAVIENLSAVKFNAASAAPTDCLISCSPNPTRGDMTFAYSLADGTESARIVITNLSGLQKKSVACDLRATAVTTSLSALQPGVYIATLVVDNTVKDSKQIVVAD